MNNTTNLKTLTLKRDALKRRSRGHLWVFSNELEKIDTTIPPGTLCGLLYPDGKPAGVGFFNPKSLIAFRLLAQNTHSLPEDFVKQRLSAALDYRKILGIEQAGLVGIVLQHQMDVAVGLRGEFACRGAEVVQQR